MIGAKCSVCGMELYMVHGLVSGAGEYFHDFSKKDAKEKYTFIHLPVPILNDPSLIDESKVPPEVLCCIGGERLRFGGKVS